jgi:hypothetical protein
MCVDQVCKCDGGASLQKWPRQNASNQVLIQCLSQTVSPHHYSLHTRFKPEMMVTMTTAAAMVVQARVVCHCPAAAAVAVPTAAGACEVITGALLAASAAAAAVAAALFPLPLLLPPLPPIRPDSTPELADAMGMAIPLSSSNTRPSTSCRARRVC